MGSRAAKAERLILSHLPTRTWELQYQGFYRARVTPVLIPALIQSHGWSESLRLLDEVIERVRGRRETYKTKLHRWQMQCYRRWLIEVRERIERYPEQG